MDFNRFGYGRVETLLHLLRQKPKQFPVLFGLTGDNGTRPLAEADAGTASSARVITSRFLLGVGQEPIPSNYRNRQPLDMRIWVFDERGNRFGSDIKFLIDREVQVLREKKLAQRA